MDQRVKHRPVSGIASAAIQLFFVYGWLSNLPKTDSFFSIYCFYALVSICCLFDNMARKPVFSRRYLAGATIFSVLFSLSVILGNYTLFQPLHSLMRIANTGLCFVGGWFIAMHILLCLMNRLPFDCVRQERSRAKTVFIVTFLAVTFVDLLYLFSTNYPAVVTVDTIAQLMQITGHSPYSSWTPYWHTMTVGLFYNIGYAVFGNPNAALAVYEVAQVLFIAACFAYVLVTLYQLGLPKAIWWIAFFVYVLNPYNIVFNVTIGKDVLFGVALLLMITALLRIITDTGTLPARNYTVFAIGSFGFCLWRTNGWYIYLIATLVFLLTFRKRKKLLLLVMAVVLVLCFFLNGPYLEAKQVEEGPFTEILAIPFQQIGRVIVNDREIPEEDMAFLSEIFRLQRVKEVYRPESADPMKFDAFRYSRMDFLEENMGSFLKIWARLGLKYPGDYLLAWADETRGYWNGGYNMGVYDQGIPDNEMGMYHSGGDNRLARLFAAYFRYVEDPIVLEPLKSIGFVVWLVLAGWWVSILQKRKTSVIAVPVLILLAGLWLGTPVFAEFRYGYPVFLVSPLILLTAMFDFRHADTLSLGEG